MGDIRPEQARRRMRKAAAAATAGERKDQSVTQKAVCAQDQRTEYRKRKEAVEAQKTYLHKKEAKVHFWGAAAAARAGSCAQTATKQQTCFSKSSSSGTSSHKERNRERERTNAASSASQRAWQKRRE